ERTDVYGLGAVLYEILTGVPTFDGSDTREVLRRVVQDPPVSPRRKVASTPRPLEAICLKALAKRPADRYASATQLAEEIQRFMADEPVQAWREPKRVKARRWFGRHRMLAAGIAAVVLVGGLCLGGTLFLVLAAHERECRARAVAEQNFAMARRAVERF